MSHRDGTAFGGSLVDADPFDVARLTVTEPVARSGLDPALIDEVITDESFAGGGDIAGLAAIEAGRGSVPGVIEV